MMVMTTMVKRVDDQSRSERASIIVVKNKKLTNVDSYIDFFLNVLFVGERRPEFSPLDIHEQILRANLSSVSVSQINDKLSTVLDTKQLLEKMLMSICG